MRVGRGLELGIAEGPGGGKILELRAGGDIHVQDLVFELLALDFAELTGLLGLGETDRAGFLLRPGPYLFSNGWQSWSFGGELRGRERIRPALLIEALNSYVLRPGPREGRGEVLSHFVARIRRGEDRIVLVSLGPGEGRAGAPLAFRLDRADLALRVEAQARGGSYRQGEVIARIACARLEGFFAERDYLRSLFAPERPFERLSFLGAEGRLVPGGYESWYNHYTAIDEKVIAADLAAIDSNDNLINSYYLSRGKPTVFQIDDGWEEAVGDWEPHAGKFPGGMEAPALAIEAKGLIPGLWLAPFIAERGSRAVAEHPDWLFRDRKGRPLRAGWNPNWSGDFYAWDLSLPAVEDWLLGLFERVVEDWGYRYLKLDFLYAGLLEGERAGGGAAWEHYERILGRITSKRSDRRGRPLAWLGCGAPLEASRRHFPLMRIGADTKEDWEDFQARLVRHQGRPAAHVNLHHSLGRAVFDGALFVNDPDVVFCRTKGMGYGEREKELVALVARLFASQIMFSDDTAAFGDPAELAFTRRIVELYDRLEGLEFGVERIGPELFRVFERKGRVRGWINLGEGRSRVADPEASGSRPEPLLPFRARAVPGGWLLEPRSISLLPTAGA